MLQRALAVVREEARRDGSGENGDAPVLAVRGHLHGAELRESDAVGTLRESGGRGERTCDEEDRRVRRARAKGATAGTRQESARAEIAQRLGEHVGRTRLGRRGGQGGRRRSRKMVESRSTQRRRSRRGGRDSRSVRYATHRQR